MVGKQRQMVRPPSLVLMAAPAVAPVAVTVRVDEADQMGRMDSTGTEQTKIPEKAKAPLPESLANLVGNCTQAVVVV